LNEDVWNEEPEHEQYHETLKFDHAHPQPQNPPYPETLNLEKLVTQPEFDFLGELKDVCVKITLFQAIKDVSIYLKLVQERCLRKLGRKRKDPQTVHVMGKLSDLMMGVFLTAKYFDPGSTIINVHINNTLITNTLIDLGVSINVMTYETMEALGLTGLREAPTILQLADISTIKWKES
jgi:hypothetical protein